MNKPTYSPFRSTISMHPRGFGFASGGPDGEDVFIPKNLTQNALDGDIVEVIVKDESAKGFEGEVISIIERARTQFVGIVLFQEKEKSRVLVPAISRDQPVTIENLKKCKKGDRLVLEVEEWLNNGQPGGFVCKKNIGSIFDASTDIEAALYDFHIRSTFPPEVEKEAKKLGTKVPEKAMKGRLDFREEICLTIDPQTAKDFDDALSITKDHRGNYHLGVHIADVAHYIPPGSHLDVEAQKRCNSTYFPGKCVPMIPYALSNELCSLKPEVPRLTMSIFMEFDPKGEMVRHRVKRTVIESKKRFTYEEAREILDGKKKHRFARELNTMHELAQLLRKARRERGSVEFSTEELELIIDDKGEPTGTEIVEHDIAHQLVEEFMIKANSVVAMHLSHQQKGMIYRIHAPPTEEDLGEFTRIASLLGHKVSSKPTPAEIQKILEVEKGTPQGKQLAIHYIRSMKLAIYTPDNIGHFGLSLEHYGHFTSPIRRYPDLIVQRLLFDEHDTSTPLGQVADACSKQERISAKAENSVIHIKKLRLLRNLIKKDPMKTFHGVIKEVKGNGIVFEISELGLEGFIPIGELARDYLVFDEKLSRLKSQSSQFQLFQTIEVVIEDLDLIRLKCRWMLKPQKHKGLSFFKKFSGNSPRSSRPVFPTKANYKVFGKKSKKKRS